MHQHYDVIIIGAGAAGLMCAVTAARRGRKVFIIEKNPKIGEKIRISGGGRSNFTNLYASPENYISNNPHFCKSALSRFSPYDFIEMLEKHDIAFHEKNLHPEVHGQLFCNKSSQQIINMLRLECEDNGVEIKTECEVLNICHSNPHNRPTDQSASSTCDSAQSPLNPLLVAVSGRDNISNLQNTEAPNFDLKTTAGEFTCRSLVIATGGLSIPKMGASDYGHKIAKQFGLELTQKRPALVPLKLDGGLLAFCKNLSGTAIDAIVRCNGVSFRENILFTHIGLSGPAILQISSYWQQGDEININLAPNIDLVSKLTQSQHSKLRTENVLGKLYSKKFVEHWIKRNQHDKILAEYTKSEIAEIANQLHNFTVKPSASAGYEKAEVTVGGVDTDEISSKSFEAKKATGLFFIGEVLDVTGWLGGYNFQWAWASGSAAGEYV